MQTDGCQLLNLFTFFSFINCWKSGWFQVEHFARYCQLRIASEYSRKKTTKNDKLLRHGQTDIHREKSPSTWIFRKFFWTLVRRKDTWGLSHSPVLIVPRVGLGRVASTIKSWDCNPPTHHKLFCGERANIQLLTRTENQTKFTQRNKTTEVQTGPFQNSANGVKQKQTTLSLLHLREQKRDVSQNAIWRVQVVCFQALFVELFLLFQRQLFVGNPTNKHEPFANDKVTSPLVKCHLSRFAFAALTKETLWKQHCPNWTCKRTAVSF